MKFQMRVYFAHYASATTKPVFSLDLWYVIKLVSFTGGGFTDARKKKTINSYKKLLRKEKRDDALHEVIKRYVRISQTLSMGQVF